MARPWQADAVPLPQLPGLESLPVADHPDLLAPSVAAALAAWSHSAEIAVVEIDPAVADTAAMNEAYGLPDTAGANCVVVAGKRDGEERVAACLVRADTRADVNNTVKRTLDVRKASFLPLERAVEESAMEYGGITPVGLPAGVAGAGRPARARHRRRDHRLRRTALEAARAGCPARRAARRRGRRGAGGYLVAVDDDAKDAADADPGDGRDETAAEKADRKWNDMLQELRVMQTGAQLTAGFLLTLPFQQRFSDLTDRQRDGYLVLVLLAAVITALVMAPVGIHRRLSGQHVKDRLVEVSARIMQVVLVCLALLVTGIVTFIFDVVVDGTSALIAGGALGLLLVVMLGVLPRVIVDD